MAVMLEVIIAVLICVLLAITTVALMVGILGSLAGELFERCPQCGRYGLTEGGRRHADECPPTWRRAVANFVHRSRGHVNLPSLEVPVPMQSAAVSEVPAP